MQSTIRVVRERTPDATISASTNAAIPPSSLAGSGPMIVNSNRKATVVPSHSPYVFSARVSADDALYGTGSQFDGLTYPTNADWGSGGVGLSQARSAYWNADGAEPRHARMPVASTGPFDAGAGAARQLHASTSSAGSYLAKIRDQPAPGTSSSDDGEFSGRLPMFEPIVDGRCTAPSSGDRRWPSDHYMQHASFDQREYRRDGEALLLRRDSPWPESYLNRLQDIGPTGIASRARTGDFSASMPRELDRPPEARTFRRHPR